MLQGCGGKDLAAGSPHPAWGWVDGRAGLDGDQGNEGNGRISPIFPSVPPCWSQSILSQTSVSRLGWKMAQNCRQMNLHVPAPRSTIRPCPLGAGTGGSLVPVPVPSPFPLGARLSGGTAVAIVLLNSPP